MFSTCWEDSAPLWSWAEARRQLETAKRRVAYVLRLPERDCHGPGGWVAAVERAESELADTALRCEVFTSAVAAGAELQDNDRLADTLRKVRELEQRRRRRAARVAARHRAPT